MKSRCVVLGVLAAVWAAGPVHGADDDKTVSFKEVAPPDPSRRPALNERHTVRPAGIVYRERAYGLPGARLTEKLTLKNTPDDGRVTISPEDSLQKHLLDGEPWYCALYPLRNSRKRHIEEGDILRPGFYVCLRDANGDAKTFEQVRILTVVLKVAKREETRRTVTTAMHRTHEHTAGGTVSPKAYVETTLDPGDGDFYDAVIELTRIEGGMIEFRSELLNKDGNREHLSASVRVPVSGPFPAVVTVPHPVEGEMIYRLGAGSNPGANKDEEVKRRQRAAQLEILAVEGGAVTYRVTRGFQPWRFWKVKTPHRVEERLRWRPRP